MTRFPLIAITCLLPAAAYPQAAPQPRFEVASIRPGGDILATRPTMTPGRFRWTTQLAYLIGYAYGLDFSRVQGTHLEGIYVVEATFAPAADSQQVRLMLQSLLADRFKLRAHRVTREVAGYGLSIAKAGLKMKETNAADSSTERAPGSVAATLPPAENGETSWTGVIVITSRKGTISQLADMLGRQLAMPVWDQTGLQGHYDFSFRYLQDVTVSPQSAVPTLATALLDSLGLKIEKQKGPLETLVVDEIAPPADN